MKTQLLALLLAVLSSAINAGWTPPPDPKPAEILKEAQADAEAERYEDALAKHVWFYRNALKHERSLYGVRLSFALSSWVRLAEVYPPALEKLKAVRDEDAETARKGGEDAREAFHGFETINENLTEEEKTKDLFVWLDHNKPNVAKQVFDLAKPALVKTKEYKLAGKYLDPANDFKRLAHDYKELTLQAEKTESGARLKQFGERRFTNGVATLIALLVVNDRKYEAAQIAEAASREWNSPEFLAALKKAWEGNVPDPWP